VPHFDAVVWVSDRDRQGTTTFSLVLDTIAQTLDYPGIAQYTHSEKQYEVEQLLRRQRVLMVVDNFETITDGVLLEWLLRLPEPSKAIITTREYRREFRNSAILVNLHGMTETETWELVDERLRVLRMETLVSDPTQLEPLLTATGGNPKAITLTMGLLKYERRPLQQIIDDLYAARGDLFDDLFSRAWALLDEAGRRILMVMTFFPDSASGEALSATADVTGFDFDRAAERLTDLSLLDVQQEDLNSEPRYVLHPLVRAFAGAQLAEQPDFEQAARERWIRWGVELTRWVKELENNPNEWYKLDAELGMLHEQMDLFDKDEETLYTITTYTFDHRRYAESLCIAGLLEYYYYIRGLWSKKLKINLMYIESSVQIGDSAEEIKMTAWHIHLLSKQGNLEDGSYYITRLQERLAQLQPPKEFLYYIRHSFALHALVCEDWDRAEQLWKEGSIESEFLPKHVQVHHQFWLAVCYYKKKRLEEAQQLLIAVLAATKEYHYPRMILFTLCYLASIHLEQKNLGAADAILQQSKECTYQYQDHEPLALIHRTYARLHTLSGDITAAHSSLLKAINLFERMGMRRELAEAREELARLEAQISAAAE
jgi:hypothetical protein